LWFSVAGHLINKHRLTPLRNKKQNTGKITGKMEELYDPRRKSEDIEVCATLTSAG